MKWHNRLFSNVTVVYDRDGKIKARSWMRLFTAPLCYISVHRGANKNNWISVYWTLLSSLGNLHHRNVVMLMLYILKYRHVMPEDKKHMSFKIHQDLGNYTFHYTMTVSIISFCLMWVDSSKYCWDIALQLSYRTKPFASNGFCSFPSGFHWNVCRLDRKKNAACSFLFFVKTTELTNRGSERTTER